MKTFKEFQASKTTGNMHRMSDFGIEKEDLAETIIDILVYDDMCYIEMHADYFWTLTGNMDVMNSDLEIVERFLYENHYIHEADHYARRES